MAERFWRHLQLISLVAVCMVLAPSSGDSQDGCFDRECVSIAGDEVAPIRVGYSQFKPFSGTSSAGIAEGYLIDLMRLLAEPLGYSLQFVAHDNPSELLKSLDAGLIDITTPLSFNSNRETYGSFTQAVHTFSFGLFVRRNGPEFLSLDDLKNMRIGVSQGSQGERRIRSIEGAIAVPLQSGDQLLLPLLAGEVDAVAAPAATIYFQLRQTGLGGRVKRSNVNLNQFPAGFLVDRNKKKLLEDLDFAISQAQALGHIQSLYDQWFLPAPDPLTAREGVFFLVASGTVIVALLYWGWLHYGVRKRAKNATERANSLQEVLNATGATLLIADRHMRPLWWNDAYARNYPDNVRSLRKGATLKELLSTGNGANSRASFGDTDARIDTEDQVVDLLTRGEMQSVDYVAGGRVLESRGVKLSSGQFGLVAMDVTALAEAHRELQSNADRLLEANRDLSEFSHVAAHDLAGPLRNIRNLHKWILDDIAETDVKLEADVIENFEHIDRLIGRQSALIDDLLAYASSDGQASRRPFEPIERWATILDLCEIPKGFEVVLPEDVPSLVADPVGFDIVMRNLISNAVKHHDRAVGKISVTREIDGSTVRILVSDDGPGIEEKYQETIFQPFKTLKSRDRGGGTGLGLAFVERTVGKWGGQVSVFSDPASRVTTFSFTVPLATKNEDQEKVVLFRAG